jgi:hypothetical protein
MPEIDEFIDEAPADSTAPIYETRYPNRRPPAPARSTHALGPVSLDLGAFRPIGSWRAQR